METPLRQGVRLGRYRLLAELGHGGMASVWVALEQTPGGARRFVALKVMLPRLANQSNFRAMFLDEGQLVRSIDHPNVVRVFEVGEDHGMLFMAMEWIEGDSLHALIRAARQRRAIPPEMAVRIIADAAAGLHEAHELRGWDGELRGVVHCDVSPHNILIGVDGRPRVVDFGVAHAAALSDDDRAGEVRGKLGYMSPEQASARPLDRRSDVFALGIVLFELTTGKRLFGRKEPKETLALVRAAQVPVPSSVWPGYPEALGAVVLKALQRDPRHRYQTAADFKQALEQFLVESRTLVSNAGVASLLSRVLGGAIRERRALVQAALGHQNEAIALPASELVPAEDLSLSIPGGRLSDPSGLFEVNSVTASVITEGTGASLSQRSVVPHVVETAAPGPRRRTGGMLALAGLTAGIGMAAVVWLWPEVPRSGASESAEPAEQGDTNVATVEERASRPAPTDQDAVRLDAIPLVSDQQPAQPGLAGHRAEPGRTDPAARQGAPVAPSSPSASKPEAAVAPKPDPDSDTGFLDEKPAAVKPGRPGADLDIENPYR